MSEIGRLRYRQVVLHADVPTGNGNIYPKEVLRKAVEEYASKTRRFGPLRADGKVALKDIAFEVMDVRMEETKIVAEIDIFDRGVGTAAALREKLARLSPVGYGTVRDGRVQDDYILAGFNIAPVEDCLCGEDGEFPE